MTDEQTPKATPKPTPEEKATKYYHEYMAAKKSDVPLSIVKEHVVRKVADDLDKGVISDDPKERAAKAFSAVDKEERQRANEQMRSGQGSFDLGEHDLIVALAGTEEVEDEEDGTVTTQFTTRDTARCRIGVIGMDEYLRWDFIQDKNRRDANNAYDRGKARLAPYLPYFQQGLTIEEIHRRGLVKGGAA
jgi:hypothetical protein